MKYSVLALLGAVVLSGCGSGNERLEEKAAIEGKAGSEASIRAENANLASRASAMEEDLEKRRRFIDSIVGTYEGTATNIAGEQGSIRLVIASSFPRSPSSGRPRSVEELAYELTNLHLNVQAVEWSALDNGSEIAFGCVFEEVRPNITDGSIHLMSEECKISYAFYAAELGNNGQLPVATVIDANASRALASEVVAGRVSEIAAFTGRKQSNLASKRMPVRLKKVASEGR